MGADHGSRVRVGPSGSAGSPATTSTLSLAFAARNAAKYSPSMSSDRSRRAAMIGTGTNPALLIARAVLTRPASPEGCWDWWGYTGSNFAVKYAPQMTAIVNMVHALGG